MQSLFDSREFNRNLFFPRPSISPTPAGATDLSVQVPEGNIHVRWHQRPRQRASLLLFHGNGEVVADYDSLAGNYSDCGVNLAVADYRGYGRSQGTPTLRNLLTDAPLVLHALNKAGVGTAVVMGRSLGSACAAELYASPPGFVLGFIWESGGADLHQLVYRRGLTPPAAFSEEELATFDPCRKLARGSHPLLVMHGKQDSLIVPAEARLAFAAAGTADKKLCLIAGHGHNDLAVSPLYWQSIREFVNKLSPA